MINECSGRGESRQLSVSHTVHCSCFRSQFLGERYLYNNPVMRLYIQFLALVGFKG